MSIRENIRLIARTSFDTEAPISDLGLSITNGIVSYRIYDKRDDFNFDISYGVHSSQLIGFPRAY